MKPLIFISVHTYLSCFTALESIPKTVRYPHGSQQNKRYRDLICSCVIFCLFILCFFVCFCFLFCLFLFCFVLFLFACLFVCLFCFVFVFVLFCFVLFCFVLFCFVLFCFVLFCFLGWRQKSVLLLVNFHIQIRGWYSISLLITWARKLVCINSV